MRHESILPHIASLLPSVITAVRWNPCRNLLTLWGRATQICVSKLPTIGSGNGLSPDQRQAIIWTTARILLIGPLGTKFGEILFEIHTFSFKKIHLKILFGKWRPFYLGLDVLTHCSVVALTILGSCCELSPITWTNAGLLSTDPNQTRSSSEIYIKTRNLFLTKMHRKTFMMTSSNRNIVRVTGHLCGKFTGPRWISRTKASDAELWCFLWFTPE